MLPFAAATANMGPHTVCDPHRDAADLAYGWCVVWALGAFNSESGGHLVLHEPKLILEFARGDIIFIPSACITHENIPIDEETEERYSLTMYSAGSLFRYRDLGFRTLESMSSKEKEEYEVRTAGYWEAGCNRFTTVEKVKEAAR